MQPNEDKKNLFDVSLSENIKVTFEQSSCPYENYACKIRDELLKQIEEDIWKIDQIKDEPQQFLEDIIGNEFDSKGDVLLITKSNISSENVKQLNETYTKKNKTILYESRKITSNKKEKNKDGTELSCEKVVKRNITRKRKIPLKGSDTVSIKQVTKANEISEQNDVDSLNLSDKPFCCDICGFRTKYKVALQSHLRTHTGDKPFSCNICSYKCSRKSHLSRHLKTHTGEKLFCCHICAYQCGTESDLKRHLRTHTGEKPFSCSICINKFKTTSQLKIHLRTHTSEKPFSCNICSYKFTQKCHLTRHLRVHTGEQPFSCNICSYKCSIKRTLTNHLRTHTGEKPFSCDICSYKFITKSNLSVHLRKHK